MRTKVIFGLGALHHLHELYPQRGIVAVVFAGCSDVLVQRISALVGERLSLLLRLPDGMPELAVVETLQEELWSDTSLHEKVLVAIGGGSVMDIAKVLRFSPLEACGLASQLDREVLTDRLRIPLVLCPTTSGTGSEVTPTSTIWDFRMGHKHSFYGPAVAADVALVDPELTLTLGPLATRDSGIDALSHALESIWNINRNPSTVSLAIAACRKIVDSLAIAINEPNNLHAREQLSQGSLWAGQAMAITQTSLAHALSYQDTIEDGLTHGHAVGRWLPYVCNLALKGDPEVRGWLKEAIGPVQCEGEGLYTWLEGLDLEPIPIEEDTERRLRVHRALQSVRGRNFSGASHV